MTTVTTATAVLDAQGLTKTFDGHRVLQAVDLKVGDRETITLSPEQGFGYRDSSNVHALSREDFSADTPLAPGMVVGFTLPNGEEVPGMVFEVNDEQVLVDFNHPFSGHQLTFEVEILDVA